MAADILSRTSTRIRRPTSYPDEITLHEIVLEPAKMLEIGIPDIPVVRHSTGRRRQVGKSGAKSNLGLGQIQPRALENLT